MLCTSNASFQCMWIWLICLYNDAISILDYQFQMVLWIVKKWPRPAAECQACMAVTDQNVILRVTTQCSLVDVHRHWEETFASVIPFNHKEGGSCSSEIFLSIYQNLITQVSQHPNRGSDWAPPKYKSRALRLHRPALLCICRPTVVLLIPCLISWRTQ